MRRIDELTGLRAIAVATVVIGHSRSFLPDWASSWYSPLFLLGHGELGVQIFFVLSGYLISTLLVREHLATGKINFWAFYLRRLLRISPAFYFFLAVMAVLTALRAVDIPWSEFWVAGTYLWNYAHALHIDGSFVSPDAIWYLGHTWTLALEEQFYWVWPTILFGILKFGWRKLLPAILVLMPVVRIATYLFFPDVRGQMTIMFHTACDWILVGCVVALYRDAITAKLGRFATNSTCFTLVTLLVMSYALPILAAPLRGYWSATVGPTIDSAFIGLMLIYLLNQPEHWICRLLSTRIFVAVGTISYSLYLWQQLFNHLTSPFFLGFPANVGFAIVAATLSYFFVERPFLQLKDRLELRRKQATPLQPAI